MTPSIKLSGNLGDRHRFFNAAVNEAYLQNTPVLDQEGSDEPAIDRLFKIDLASKQKNVDYIIHTLKDDDMLYVSRALKSVWLLHADYSNIINPSSLENELFPQMITPAVNKMRHWIHMHLRDPQRCKEFYQYYKDKKFNIAAKFLWHCSNECILGEISSILDKITPKLLKRLSEKAPEITKMYYDNLKLNPNLLKYYLTYDYEFFDTVKHLLKSDADTYFYILENFFAHEKFSALNALTTKYILKNHRNRFMCKREIYTAWILDMKTLAKYLSSEEIKDLVLTLARAEYLKSWFSYQNVELLIKRLKEPERTALKKIVFVDKVFGTTVKECPYSIPIPPELTTPQTSLFDDTDPNDVYNIFYVYGSDCSYECYEECAQQPFRSMLKKRKYCKRQRKETLLDQLFNQYRFSNYTETYSGLRKQLNAESSPQNRQFMFLVLVSKTGGQTENLVSLMDLLSQFKNEPVHIRAAIIRSLVKRAFVWRLPNQHWARILEWGHGLGLDGSTSEAECREGLHAVVIRDLLANVKPSQKVWEKFLADFDTLHDYSFTTEERGHVSFRLSNFLLRDAQSDPEKPKLNQLQLLLNTFKAYKMRFDYFPGTVDSIALAFKCYSTSSDYEQRTETEYLLRQLYNARVARKRLIKDYFEINQSDASYVNALRHDISILEDTRKFEKLIDGKNLKHETFFRKLALHFVEKDGIGERYRAMLQHRALTTPDKSVVKTKGSYSESETTLKGRQILARPIAFLSGSTFPSLLETLDVTPPKTAKRQLAAALRGNAHLVRPAFDLKSFGWRKAGAKAVANRIIVCRAREVEGYLAETTSWKRTLRVAVVLAERVNKEQDVFRVIASERPGAALQAALRYFCRRRNNSNLSIWELVKSRISEINSKQLPSCVELTELMPNGIKAEFSFLVYLACVKNASDMKWRAFQKIPTILAELPDKYIFDVNQVWLNDYLPVKETNKKIRHNTINIKYTLLYLQIIAKFLLLNTTQEMLEEKIRKVGIPLLNRLEQSWINLTQNEPDYNILGYFLLHLKDTKAYLNPKYVSCLPVFQKITEWMHSFLPIERWFKKYDSVHIIMIYYKTVRHCIKQNPELFSEEYKKIEGAKMMGTVFGKFISNEIEELQHKYFPTIIEVYAACLVEYFNKYICHSFDESVQNFVVSILKGLLANESQSSCILTKYIFDAFRERLKDEYVNEILNHLKMSQVKELRFYLTFNDISNL